MKINIETYANNKYEDISKEYGNVLSRFGFIETEEGNATIVIEDLKDLFDLHRKIEKFIDESDEYIPYFGIMIKSYDDGTPYLEIKDNYD